jgi:hypothetical protein
MLRDHLGCTLVMYPTDKLSKQKSRLKISEKVPYPNVGGLRPSAKELNLRPSMRATPVASRPA